MIETSDDRGIWAVAFDADGVLLSGKDDGVRRWGVADGQEIGNQTGMNVRAISVSRDGKWIVFGTWNGASVWDAKMQENAIEVEGTDYVGAVDISPASTRFATAAGVYSDDKAASIWDIVTGERLVGPLRHDKYIAGVKFSPNGEHIATATSHSIRVFHSHNGDQLITIKTDIHSSWPSTSLAWSNNGQQFFAASRDREIKCFDVSSGSQLAKSQVQGDGELDSIALAANGKFLATFVDHSISFWDISTLTQIGPVIEDSQDIMSIVLSPDFSYLATGGCGGNITIRNLNNLLPELYGPFRVSIYAFTILSNESHIVFPLLISFRHLLKKNPGRRDLVICHNNNISRLRPRESMTKSRRIRLRYEFVILSRKSPTDSGIPTQGTSHDVKSARVRESPQGQ